MEVRHLVTLEGHREPIYQILPCSDHEFFSASGDGIVAKWNTNKNNSEAVLQCNSGLFTITLINNEVLVAGTNEGIVHCFDCKKKTIIKSIKISEKQIFAIEYVSSTNQLFIGDGEGKCTIINAKDFTIENQINIANKSLRTIAINADESLLAIGSSTNEIFNYSIPNWNLISTLTSSENSVFCAKFLSNVNLLTGGRDAHLRLWNVVEQEQLQAIPAHFFTINDLALHQNLVATAARDKSVKLWRKDDLQLLKVISADKFPEQIRHSVNSVAFLNKQLIFGGDDRKISIWQIEDE